MEKIQEITLETLKRNNAILSGHFKLTSGRHSATYMQCAKLFTNAKDSEMLCKMLVEKLNNVAIDIVVSPAIGGILMGYEISRILNVPNIFCERENGQMALRRGFSIPSTFKALVVEDVVTTGGSVKEVIALLKSMNIEVVAVASIVDRSNGKVDFGYRYESLLSIDVISYDETECPLCKENMPIVKPGSRQI